MKGYPGMRGIAYKEDLLWEKSRKGRVGISIPEADVPGADLDPSLVGAEPNLPELSEVDVVRHYTRLSTWNFGLDTGMYPLGSCTMKYNPKINEAMAALPGFANLHPLLPDECMQGALKLMYEFEQDLLKITGMKAATLEPAAGAQGELTGMLMIHAYHAHKGRQRTKLIMPSTAHGTNPASGALCGYTPVPVELSADGVVTPDAIRAIMDEDTAGIMLTNPNTLGIFENHVAEVAEIIHEKGGLVYGDGANVRDWLYVEDHCRAIDLVLQKGRTGEVYNIGGHNERANIDVVKVILRALKKPESLISYVADRKGHDRRYAIDPTKIHTELGWLPETRFEDGIERTIAWYLENRAWWQHILDGSYRKAYPST